MGAISLGPVTDTEIKLTKEVLNAVVNATWTYRGSVAKVGVAPDPK